MSRQLPREDDASLVRATPESDRLPELRARKVLGCLDVDAFEDALGEEGWGVADELAVVLSIARSEEVDPRDRLAALEVLQKRRIDALRYSGLLAKVQQIHSEDGTGNVTRTTTIQAVGLRRDAESALSTTEQLRAAVRTARVIEPERMIDTNGTYQSSSGDSAAVGGGAVGAPGGAVEGCVGCGESDDNRRGSCGECPPGAPDGAEPVPECPEERVETSAPEGDVGAADVG